MATITKRKKQNGSFTYKACIRIKGYPTVTATFDKMSDAKIWVAENEAPRKKGLHIKNCSAQKHTVAELIDRYIEFKLSERNSDIDKFKMHLAWWKKEIGAYYLSALDNIMLTEYRDKLSKEKCLIPRKNMSPKISERTRSNATVNRYMATLSIVLSTAVKEYGWLNENPMLKVVKKKEPRGRVRFLQDKEVCRLLTECRKLSYELYLCVLIALSTGARYSEILGLQWENVDLIHRQFNFLNTKNGEDRGVAITSVVYNELIKFKKVRNINSNYLLLLQHRKVLFQICLLLLTNSEIAVHMKNAFIRK